MGGIRVSDEPKCRCVYVLEEWRPGPLKYRQQARSASIPVCMARDGTLWSVPQQACLNPVAE